MKTFETTATVDRNGKLLLDSVPFAPGSEVEVTVTAADNNQSASDAADRATRLFAALDQSQNTETVGPLRREELYDRDVLR